MVCSKLFLCSSVCLRLSCWKVKLKPFAASNSFSYSILLYFVSSIFPSTLTTLHDYAEEKHPPQHDAATVFLYGNGVYMFSLPGVGQPWPGWVLNNGTVLREVFKAWDIVLEPNPDLNVSTTFYSTCLLCSFVFMILFVSLMFSNKPLKTAGFILGINTQLVSLY
ncbi:hypothetical protein AMECASPLE_005005 [Ameca splendens]|uniref:Uncharacterized protein n=1 Tax=Ameca splendens TaxID=208324 RepID=A0ABV1A7V2_9TELE